ncbi:MAG: hypothetical protein Q9217_004532 [Psora testacea]
MEELGHEDHEKLELSDSTLAALKDFYSERERREQRFEELKAAAERDDPEVIWSMEMFIEDWNASQFWYTEDTAIKLAKELLRGATSETSIAVISAPSVLVQLKNLVRMEDLPKGKPNICLLEYDERFNIFPEFVHYNFKRPFELNKQMKGQYDRILCDPPFLSTDCQTKVAMTVRWLSRRLGDEEVSASKPRIIVCTGGRMKEMVHKLYPGIWTTTFEPRHAKDRLSNDFRCYANFHSKQWSYRTNLRENGINRRRVSFMLHMRHLAFLTVLSLVELFPRAFAHGHDDPGNGGMGGGGAPVAHSTPLASDIASANMTSSQSSPESYFAFPEFGGLILAHIVLMTIAWFFLLPIGVMLSIAQSRLALVVQLSFLAIHSIALSLGTIYTYNTPQLYENNSHNKVGWIVTWVVVAQCVTGIIKLAASITQGEDTVTEEQVAFLPMTTQALEQHRQAQQDAPDPYRYSRDSGHFTASEPSRSQSVSSTATFTQEEQQKPYEYDADHDDDIDQHYSKKRGLLGNPKVERLASSFTAMLSKRTMRGINTVHNVIDRTILLMGFVAFVTGAAVYGGVFRGNSIFNGLAHIIKGGIFFWYGLLTLGRWMGCFVEFGWAWNVRPPVGVVGSGKAAIPSAEFVESFVIFLYGSTNVFLEHLAAWGQAWSAQDLEHVSITIMFFGGGLCGMLIESTRIRDLLNTVVLTLPAGPGHGSQSTKEKLTPPKTYGLSMNPVPALIILLLGLMMSSHYQSSIVSTMVHKQWGTLFVGFALARGVTYILTYIAPPSSYLPSRPPSEIISSFCLISGGIIFMASNRDTVAAMEHYGLHAMFPFTVTMGFTAFLMAWVIIVLTVKGWAVRRKLSSAMFHHVEAA